MKNPRRTLFYIFLGYHLFLFLGTLYVDSRQDDLGFLLNIKGYIPWMKYYAFLGLILFLVAYVVVVRDNRVLAKDVSKSKDEHTKLKAKLFDLEEEKRELTGNTQQPAISTSSPTEETPEESVDQDSAEADSDTKS